MIITKEGNVFAFGNNQNYKLTIPRETMMENIKNFPIPMKTIYFTRPDCMTIDNS